ncbi:hypothetical protein BX600DRAFT_317507 [Xylariales sp. PMI_506]|nr:hypothetical protein BX600DRAFT_317507 [Xylariales sp. PMI_506]
MSQYYGESQWLGAGTGAGTGNAAGVGASQQPTWDHQTPPPARSGASSAIPREESAAFTQQLEEVDRAIDNLVKSGKMFGSQQPRRPSFGDVRGHGPGHTGPGLQNFYASQRHQPSRGSNEAEQMMQAKRRMAAQRERELRNYHQEQQYNRTVLAEMYPGKPERALSPGNMSEDERRDLIARQRSALYGEGSFSDNGAYVDETGAARNGAPGLSTAPSSHRGPSPLAFDYARGGADGAAQSHDSQVSRNASPQSNPPNSKGPFDSAVQQASRTSNSSPGGSPPRQGGPAGQANAVAPIGTRPSISGQAPNPALRKQSTTPLPSPLSHGFSASGKGEDAAQGPATSGAPSQSNTATDSYNGWGNRSGVWGKQSSGLGVQASVWG